MSNIWKKIIMPLLTAAVLGCLSLYALGVFTDSPKEVAGYADPSGGSYSGIMQKDKYEGYGSLLLPNGDSYAGNFKANLMDGYGSYTSTKSWQYEGGFSEDLPSGRGIFKTSDGGSYDGEFRLGDISGEGKFTAKAGWSFEGTLKNGEFVKGKLTLKDGSYYDGPFKDGLAEGQGLFSYHRDGKELWRYEGGFAAGQRSGKGTLTTLDPTNGKVVMTESGTWSKNVLK
ncbi:MAG: hypothetical protein LBQ80_01745 [Clostridium sp.]|jgi:hypothetical protein|nr:hypothetical protein [Clostridium sp.]